MLLRNNSLLEYSENAEKDPLGKEEEAMAEEVEPPKALAIACVPEGGFWMPSALILSISAAS